MTPVAIKRVVRLVVNGEPIEAEVEPRTHVADFVRESLSLTGTHLGCEHGVCGACTIEIDGGFADFAGQWVARSEVSGRIEVIRGDGREVLPGIPEASVDAAFIDADKAGYPFYARECLRILRPGGLLMADNAFAFGELFTEGEVEESVHHLRAFNDEMAKLPGMHAIIIPIGDGCWVGVKT